MTKKRINITIEPSIWETAKSGAGRTLRSLSGYLEYLITEDNKEEVKRSLRNQKVVKKG